jgi:hypothetical protein
MHKLQILGDGTFDPSQNVYFDAARFFSSFSNIQTVLNTSFLKSKFWIVLVSIDTDLAKSVRIHADLDQQHLYSEVE